VRLFVAAYPSVAALQHFGDRVSSLAVTEFAGASGVNARLADPALWHLTMSFIGEVPDDAGPAAAGAIDAAVVDIGPAQVGLQLAGGGTFGRGRFTTMWVGLAGDVPRLAEIAAAVTKRLRRARIPYDRKPFRPHLTIARPGDRVPKDVLASSLEQLHAYAGPTWTLTELCLVSSHLGPKPVHEVVHRAAIAEPRMDR
jgi:2'-5' RNA ligase